MRPTGEWLNQPGGLAERLQRMRKASGLTGVGLAERLRWTRARVPKLENGRQMPTEADIRAWAEATGHPEAIPELLDMLAEGQTVHRQWKLRLKGGLTAIQEEIAALEQTAKVIRVFDLAFVPGLLQTEDYARYRLLEATRKYGVKDVDTAVAARMRRQRVLFSPGKAFEFVTTEAALRFLLCPRDVMLRQLEQLQVFTTSSSLTLGIIPFGIELDRAPVAGFFTIDDQTLVELPAGDDQMAARASADYDRVFADLMAESVTGDGARRLIATAAESLRAA